MTRLDDETRTMDDLVDAAYSRVLNAGLRGADAHEQVSPLDIQLATVRYSLQKTRQIVREEFDRRSIPPKSSSSNGLASALKTILRDKGPTVGGTGGLLAVLAYLIDKF